MNFRDKIIQLAKNCESMTLEKYPYRFHRTLVRSKGIQFYMYQPTDLDYTMIKDLDLNMLGEIKKQDYWDLTQEYDEKIKNANLKKIMES